MTAEISALTAGHDMAALMARLEAANVPCGPVNTIDQVFDEPQAKHRRLEIEQARSAVINAAAALDADRITRERALSAAKMSIGRIGTLVAEECIQLHGGIGMTWELPLAHYAKRLVMIDHQLGDEDFHLERYIALGRDAA